MRQSPPSKPINVQLYRMDGMIVWFGCVQQEQDVLLVSHVGRPSKSRRAQGFSHSLSRSDSFLVHSGWEILRAPDGFLASLSGPKSGSVSRSS